MLQLRCTTHATRLPSHSDLKYPPPSPPAYPPPFPPTQPTAPYSCPQCLKIPQPPESMPLGRGLNPYSNIPAAKKELESLCMPALFDKLVSGSKSRAGEGPERGVSEKMKNVDLKEGSTK